MDDRVAPDPDSTDAASLTGMLLEEEERREAAGQDEGRVELEDEALPGVGGDTMRLGQALRIGGPSMVVVLGLGSCIEWIERTGFAVLAPDIQQTLGVSDAVIGAMGGAFGLLYLAGSIPISSLADRYTRKNIAATAITLWSLVVFTMGMVQNAFQLFVARLASGLGQSYSLPVNNPLLVDTYPIEARGRILALFFAFNSAGQASAPLIVGSIAGIIGGPEAWRWVFVIIAVSALPIAFATYRLHEPRRGRHEMQSVLGEEMADAGDEVPISLSVAFERLRKIKSFYYFLLGMAALGFALFSVPLFINLMFEDRFDLGAFGRGVVYSIILLPGFLALAIAGRKADRLYTASPPTTMLFIGGLVTAFGVFIAVGVFMPNLVLVTLFLAIGLALSQAAFAVIVAPIAAIIPYRLRSRGIALIGVYVFVFGGFGGAVLTGLLSDRIGISAAIATVVLPSTIIGGGLISYGARYVRGDASAIVEELEEERDEAARRREAGADIPVLQVRNLDFSYGKVQILFDVDLDVHRGETLALLGTNGAGKSTLLRVVSGLGVATRGVVRFHGRTVTYADPELRTKIGMVALMGGNAVFAPLTVGENLRMAGYLYRGQDLRRRRDAVLELFPQLRGRISTRAGDLSGGQQQMLALAMTLIHEPEVLIIDELSLGLAPVVVQDLLGVVEDLKARGLTMIIVEQSLNVALAVADRAVFMEKGTVRFEGTATELLERDDLARAVFLGSGAGP